MESVNDLLKLFMRQAQRERRVAQPYQALARDVKTRPFDRRQGRDVTGDDALMLEEHDHDRV